MWYPTLSRTTTLFAAHRGSARRTCLRVGLSADALTVSYETMPLILQRLALCHACAP